MRRVKFDPKLPTVSGGQRQVKLTQAELDSKVRAAAVPAAVESLVRETATYWQYQLSDGRLLKIIKSTGECLVGDTKS
jgi:hypothetical protein